MYNGEGCPEWNKKSEPIPLLSQTPKGLYNEIKRKVPHHATITVDLKELTSHIEWTQSQTYPEEELRVAETNSLDIRQDPTIYTQDINTGRDWTGTIYDLNIRNT